MKTKTFLLVFLIFAIAAHAQILDRIKNTAQRSAERKLEQKTEEKTNDVIDGILSGKKKQKKDRNSSASSSDSRNSSSNNKSSSKSTARANKNSSDFVPGNQVIFSDNFSKDALGDFPAQWNTTGSGDVTTVNGLNGKWLNIAHNSVITPEMSKTLPENCTIEFDLFLQNDSGKTPRIEFGLTPVRNILKEDLYYKEKFYMSLGRYDEPDGQFVEYGLKDLIGNKNNFPLTQYENKVLHVAMAINGTRIRVYFDGEKLIDLPRALTSAMRNNFFITNVYTIPASEQGVLVSNVRIAAATVDARSSVSKQLMEEGKFTTNDILFDVNKDVIKSSSFSILNEIGETLKQNSSLKIRIIGHTDSDGETGANQILSEKRANSVKNYLQENYSVSSNRITTVGMGESQPISSNNSSEGKAKNRRVEFVKI